jgi:Pyridine nucleotide-disulphide oxidoreductase
MLRGLILFPVLAMLNIRSARTVGTVEYRSIIQPTRFITRHKRRAVAFYEGEVESVDRKTKTVTFSDKSEIKGKSSTSSIQYDALVFAPGAANNTFRIPGVEENACFLKEVSDAEKIRKRVMDCEGYLLLDFFVSRKLTIRRELQVWRPQRSRVRVRRRSGGSCIWSWFVAGRAVLSSVVPQPALIWSVPCPPLFLPGRRWTDGCRICGRVA